MHVEQAELLNGDQKLAKISEVPLGIKAAAVWTSSENAFALSSSKDLPSGFPDLQLILGEPAFKASRKHDAANAPLDSGPSDCEGPREGIKKFEREEHIRHPKAGGTQHADWSKKIIYPSAAEWDALARKLEQASKKYATHKH